MQQKRLSSGIETKKNKVFPKRAKTWLICGGAVAVIFFIALPLELEQLGMANSSHYLEASEGGKTQTAPSATPIPSPVCDFVIEDSPVPPDSVSISQFSLLQENDDYPAVEQLQVRLMDLGYLDSDEPSTVYGSATKVAVSLYQRTVNAEMDGIADAALQEALFSSDAKAYQMKLGDSGTDVKSMQTRLTELGYYDGKISGYYGVATEGAVLGFQKKNGLSQDGVFNMENRDVLFSPDARPKIDPTPTPSPTPKPTRKPTIKPTATPKPETSADSGDNALTVTETPRPSTATPIPSDSNEGIENENGGSDSGASSGGSDFNASYSVDGLLSVANAQLGKRYVWAEEGPDTFDCSGFVYYCLRSCGVKTSRYSASGFSNVSSWASVSSIGDLSVGDLLFFRNDNSSRISHTGIYIGGNQFIHASSSAGKVIISSITTSYWTRNFMLGRRVF